MSKYDPLREYLSHHAGSVTLSFDRVADLVGGLPRSAYEYTAWWTNEDVTHSHSLSWGGAGYLAHADLPRRTVTFDPK